MKNVTVNVLWLMAEKTPEIWHEALAAGRLVDGVRVELPDSFELPQLPPAPAARIAVKIGGKSVMFGDEQMAAKELQAARLEVCGTCEFNEGGICRQCCGSIAVVGLVRLRASRCAKGFWTA